MNGTEDVSDEMSEEEDQAGIILGLHNVAVRLSLSLTIVPLSDNLPGFRATGCCDIDFEHHLQSFAAAQRCPRRRLSRVVFEIRWYHGLSIGVADLENGRA